MIQFYDKLTCFLCRFRHGKTSRRAQQNFLTSGNFRGDVREFLRLRSAVF